MSTSFGKLFILIGLVIALTFLSFFMKTADGVYKSGVKIGGQAFDVELADSSAEQGLGLSGRASLPPDRAMVFIYQTPGFPQFWMKSMKFSIDIIWVSQGLEVIDLDENVSPATYPSHFTPPKPTLYVIEVNAGTVKDKKIKIGDTVEFSQALEF